MNIKLLIVLLFTSNLSICQSDKIIEKRTLNKEDYSIEYTNNLKLDESKKFGNEFVLFSRKTSQFDNFTENINLMIQNLKSLNVDLNKFVEITEKQIETNGDLISSERIKYENVEFQKLVYTARLNNFDLKFIQYDFVKYSQAYVLTFTAQESNFDKYAHDMERIMKTFELK